MLEEYLQVEEFKLKSKIFYYYYYKLKCIVLINNIF